MQKIVIGIVVALAVIGVGTFIVNSQNSSKLAVVDSPLPTPILSAETPAPSPTTPVPAPTPTPTPKPTPTPVASLYSMSAVAKHSTEDNCWSVINGKVYDLTSWIGSHPGGQQAITQLCGKDGSAKFNGQHAGGAQQAQVLTKYFLSDLTQ